MIRHSVSIAFGVFILLKGLAFPIFEFAIAAFPVLFLSAVRFYIASVILIGYIIWTDTAWKPQTSGDYIAIIGGGVIAFAFSTAFWSIGQMMTSSALSGLMASLVPILTAGFSWILIPKDRLTQRGIGGLAIAFIGAIVIMLPGMGLEINPKIIGKILLFLGVAGSAFGSVVIRWAQPSLPASSQTAWALVLSAIVLHLSSIGVGEQVNNSTQTIIGIFALLFLGLMVDALGKVILFWLLDRRSAIEINLTAYVTPVIAGLAGWVLFGDEISASMIGGFIIVLVGFGLMKSKALQTEYNRSGWNL